MIEVLDKGYVRFVDSMGDDLTVVNSAKVSFDKEASELGPKEDRLIRFLLNRNETSPFRHAVMSFEVYAPLMIARQWWKYSVASTHTDDQQGWNESSRRYVTEEPAFYIPATNEWRKAPADKKQGSEGFLQDYDYGGVPKDTTGYFWTQRLQDHVRSAIVDYEYAIAAGIAPEQARLFLPAYGMYIRWRWTVSLNAVLHFLTQRLASKAQEEIQLYAQAIESLTTEKFPATMKWFKEINESETVR